MYMRYPFWFVGYRFSCLESDSILAGADIDPGAEGNCVVRFWELRSALSRAWCPLMTCFIFEESVRRTAVRTFKFGGGWRKGKGRDREGTRESEERAFWWHLLGRIIVPARGGVCQTIFNNNSSEVDMRPLNVSDFVLGCKRPFALPIISSDGRLDRKVRLAVHNVEYSSHSSSYPVDKLTCCISYTFIREIERRRTFRATIPFQNPHCSHWGDCWRWPLFTDW